MSPAAAAAAIENACRNWVRRSSLWTNRIRFPPAVLAELGRRGATHVLLESGPTLLGAFFDSHAIDEVHVFVAPKIIGGTQARSAVAGTGRDRVPSVSQLQQLRVRQIDTDVLIEGRWIRD